MAAQPPAAKPVLIESTGLTFDEKERLVRLFMELRQPPFGLIGMIETRNLLERLFEDFAEVRDSDIDSLIREYASSQGQEENYTNPNQLQIT